MNRAYDIGKEVITVGTTAVLVCKADFSWKVLQNIECYMALSAEKILEHYTNIWSIEVMFRQHKQYMGFKTSMVLSVKAADRLMLVPWPWLSSPPPVA